MTLVLGGRCNDGVVIVTDMKITSLATGTPKFLRYESKISGVFTNIIFGYAGDVETYEVYLNYAVGDSVRKRDDPIETYTNDNFIQKLHGNMVKLRNVLVQGGKILLLRILVGRQFPGNGKSDLHTVTSNLYPDAELIENRTNTYTVIGDAERYAADLIRHKWKPDMTMRGFAELSYSVIRYIELKNISATVGLGSNKPPIRYLSNSGNVDTDLSDQEWERFKETYQIYADYFDRIVPPSLEES
jgi:hypothetical protein